VKGEEGCDSRGGLWCEMKVVIGEGGCDVKGRL